MSRNDRLDIFSRVLGLSQIFSTVFKDIKPMMRFIRSPVATTSRRYLVREHFCPSHATSMFVSNFPWSSAAPLCHLFSVLWLGGLYWQKLHTVLLTEEISRIISWLLALTILIIMNFSANIRDYQLQLNWLAFFALCKWKLELIRGSFWAVWRTLVLGKLRCFVFFFCFDDIYMQTTNQKKH